MRWALALTIAFLVLMFVFSKPISIHQGYQVVWKGDVCMKALDIVKTEGYKLLLKEVGLEGAELTESCSSSSIAYCLIIPGTVPLKFLKVEKG